jgi:uncharacterized membrane protein HdeD (DUF308 family)
MTRQPVVRDARTAQLLGAACIIAGSFLLYDAFEARGRTKSWGWKLLPGV